ncbi:PAS domain-containing protein [Sphingosinithalassobacter portus]|uniref:PAS domain-containing protein n=1 Tax=Stakelama portus TaxID=2676234 RepID=UPI000D6E2C0D|nr:PAS domain-containing protein [Sphingosinithalassobacter portus]
MAFAFPVLFRSRAPALDAAISSDDGVAHAAPALPATWQCDLSDNSLQWSPGVFDLFGVKRGTRLDRREVARMYIDDSRALMERLRAAAIANRAAFTMEAQIRRADGALRWMRLSADVVCRGGRVTHLYGTKQDITAEWHIS